MILLIIALSIISAILYRAGGMDKQVKHWIPVWMRHSWVRDYLCPVCALFPLIMIKESWLFVPTYALSVAALSTYWDDWFHGVDTYWFAGLMCGLALFPLLFGVIAWLPFLLKAAAISLTWWAICEYSANDFVEEYGRGFFFSFTTIIFLFA